MSVFFLSYKICCWKVSLSMGLNLFLNNLNSGMHMPGIMRTGVVLPLFLAIGAILGWLLFCVMPCVPVGSWSNNLDLMEEDGESSVINGTNCRTAWPMH